jgi:hypothetical protein
LGGGIRGQNITVRESRITGNTADQGGGIHNDSGSLHVIDSEISDNVAAYGDGGGIWSRALTGGAYEVEIVNSTISGNQATGKGGGVFNYETQYGDGLVVKITNSTISGNSASTGGGLYNYFNYTAYEGPLNAPPTITNTIIAGNNATADSDTDDVGGGAVDSSSAHNLIGFDPNEIFQIGNGNQLDRVSAIDAHLGALAFNGGTMRTHALLYNSTAIDAGDNDFVDDPDFAFDQRGKPWKRIVDWEGDDSSETVDIGAFELALGEFYS